MARDIPVFERGYSTSLNPSTRMGLGEGIGPRMRFSCLPQDKRPGKPLPPEATGDPAPDRLERAEALRQAILKQESRLKIDGSVDRIDIRESRNTKRGPRTLTPDLEKPRSHYIAIDPENARFEARRGDQVLLFPTASEAARCMMGEHNPKWAKAVQNAAAGITSQAFGWAWYRVGPRRGARRKALK